jgi:hypothetical protein
MKRRAFTVLSFSFLCLMFSIQVSRAQSISEGLKSNPETAIKDIDIAKLLPYFYQLWKDSAFGNDPNRTERAAWIIRKSDGIIEFVRWPSSGAWAREVWVGPPPENIVAQAHTHPAKRDPKPSSGDRSLSTRTNVPFYTISANGIWRVTTDGKMTKLTGNDWYEPVRQAFLTPELKGE